MRDETLIFEKMWIYLFLVSIITILYAGLKVLMIDGIEFYLNINSRTVATHHFILYISTYPWIWLVPALYGAGIMIFCRMRNYGNIVYHSAMIPIYAALSITIMAGTYIGGKFIIY